MSDRCKRAPKAAAVAIEPLEGRALLALFTLQSAVVRPDGRIVDLTFAGPKTGTGAMPDWLPAFTTGNRLTTSTGVELEPLGTVVTNPATNRIWTTSFLVHDPSDVITFDTANLTVSAGVGLIRDGAGNRTEAILAAPVLNKSLVDADGFTTQSFERGAGGVTLYVSARYGNDARSLADVQDPRTPLKSPQRAFQLLAQAGLTETGSAVRLLRGDAFKGDIVVNSGGQDRRHPFVLEDYWYDYGDGRSDPGTRPVVEVDWAKGERVGLTIRPNQKLMHKLHDVVIRRIAFRAVNRTTQPGFGVGVKLANGSCGFTLDDVVVDNFVNGVGISGKGSAQGNQAPSLSDVTILRTTVTDAHATDSAFAQGMFVTKTKGLLVSQSTFDRNGRLGEQLNVRNIFSHNLYLQVKQGPAVVWGNVIRDGGSHGVQMRSGGILAYNYLAGNAIAAYIGKPGGAMTHNVVEGATDIGPNPRGWGLQFVATEGPLNAAAMEFNVIVHAETKGVARALLLGGPGVRAGLVRNNTIVDSGFITYQKPGKLGGDTIRIESNIVDNGDGLVTHVDAGAKAVWRRILTDGNVYYSAASPRGFRIGGALMATPQWRERTQQEANSLWVQAQFVNRDASIADYAARLGVSDEAGFEALIRGRESGVWGTQFDAGRLFDFFTEQYRPTNLPQSGAPLGYFGASEYGIAAPDLLSSSDTGDSDSDNVTGRNEDLEFAIANTRVGARVELWRDAMLVAVGVGLIEPLVLVDTTLLADGTYDYTARQIDDLGRVLVSRFTRVTIDTKPPGGVGN
jgi:hypothetical protein